MKNLNNCPVKVLIVYVNLWPVKRCSTPVHFSMILLINQTKRNRPKNTSSDFAIEKCSFCSRFSLRTVINLDDSFLLQIMDKTHLFGLLFWTENDNSSIFRGFYPLFWMKKQNSKFSFMRMEKFEIWLFLWKDWY